MLVSAGNVISNGAPWEINGPYYAGKSLSVAAQESATKGLAFSGDGTKAYIIGLTNDTIYQYTLTTAWDISTGSYASKSLSVTAQASTPHGLAFSQDGTKAYVVNNANATIYQYTLGTAWDISTGSYASKSFSASGHLSAPEDLAFSQDGTKAYILSGSTNRTHQETLGTAWDISTASSASKSFTINGHQNSAQGIVFSAAGDRFYVIGDTPIAILQSNLSVAWDISTCSYTGKSGLVYPQTPESDPAALAFSPDGTRVYIVGTVNNTIYQFEMI